VRAEEVAVGPFQLLPELDVLDIRHGPIRLSVDLDQHVLIQPHVRYTTRWLGQFIQRRPLGDLPLSELGTRNRIRSQIGEHLAHRGEGRVGAIQRAILAAGVVEAVLPGARRTREESRRILVPAHPMPGLGRTTNGPTQTLQDFVRQRARSGREHVRWPPLHSGKLDYSGARVNAFAAGTIKRRSSTDWAVRSTRTGASSSSLLLEPKNHASAVSSSKASTSMRVAW
jgi:hypothetical protein